MLKLVNINKIYQSGEIKTVALKKINLEFRKNEFVSILGPSGCGKTTMLNIIGGLDKYSSGDLIINGVSTREYKDKDWDTYRNHSVGFVFQSYNLIPHLTVLENVQLALTLSGISKEESKKRAIKVLTRVGLKDKLHNKPSQLSGGQMQRVAIARALVNDPEIILADEPTGALDTKSSVQIMNLLKEISNDKLIIMVTHNSNLAMEYSSRIVNLLDGEVTGDSNPFSDISQKEDKLLSVSSDENLSKSELKKKNKKKRMSFFTALSLSFKNLLTKKGRTALVTFAGSIGIIGIALVLAISSGFSTYVNKTQQDTLSTYPVTISNTNYNLASIMEMFMSSNGEIKGQDGKVYTKEELVEMLSKFNASSMTNDLKSFKSYIENDGQDEIKKYSSAIQYTYSNLFVNAYYDSSENGLINANSTSVFSDAISKYKTNNPEMENNAKFKLLESVFTSEFSFFSSAFWSEMIDNESLLNSQYELVGENSRWAKEYNEVNVVIDKNNQISDYTLYGLGLLNQDNLYTLVDNYVKGKDAQSQNQIFEYNEIIGMTYKIIPESDFYVEKDGVYVDIRKPENKDLYDANIDSIYSSGIEVKVTGIIREKENVSAYSLNTNIVYTNALTSYLIDKSNNTQLISLQKVSNKNLLTGQDFSNEMERLNILSVLGYVDESSPSSINIYPIDFEAKENISSFISNYNELVRENGEEEKVISYTDTVGVMMNTISTIISAITYVLIAFVGVSLVVSSIMIGIITYISVLERTKEIGVLRSVGASKRDVKRVFTAESFIIGLLSGLFGILVAGLITIPINIILKSFTDISGLANLPIVEAIILVVISVVLTYIAGLIPSKIATKKDPVVALREV